MKKRITLLFVVNFLCLFAASAQGSQPAHSPSIFTSVDEAVFLHGNSSTLLTGETFYYAFYNWNKKSKNLSNISKIGYVELVNDQGKSVLKQKINLKNGLGHGDFFVSPEFKTGNYKLLAYTKWMLNGPISNLYQLNLLIINPFAELSEEMIADTKNDSIAIIQQSDDTIEPKNIEKTRFDFLTKTLYTSREKVAFVLDKNFLKPGNYSISIRKMDKLPGDKSISAEEFIAKVEKSNMISSKNNTQKFLPELRGEVFSGQIQNKKNSTDLNNKNIGISLPGKSFAFKTSQTNENGEFWFILDPNPNNANATIQVMEEDRANYTLSLKQTTIDFSKLDFRNLKLSKNLRDQLEKHSTAIQIQNAYYHEKRDSIMVKATATPFYFPVAKDYILENYTSFPKLKETIIEIIPEMYSSKNKDGYQLGLRDYYNEENQSVYGKTLVLVDGLLVQDLHSLFAYDTRKLEKISIVPKGYIYGAKIYDGVASFITKEQDFSSGEAGDYILKTSLLRPLPQKKYFNPEYGPGAKNERIPDYRYQLLWLPEISFSTEAETVSFYTSDVTGNFKIVLKGFTEKGKPVNFTQVFKVQ